MTDSKNLRGKRPSALIANKNFANSRGEGVRENKIGGSPIFTAKSREIMLQ
jgi:hypothetical protein